MNSNNIFMKPTKPAFQDINNVINLKFSDSESFNNYAQKGGRLNRSSIGNNDSVLNLSFSPSVQVPSKQYGGASDVLNLSFSPSIQVPHSSSNDNVFLKSQSGGSSDNVLNLSFSPSIQVPHNGPQMGGSSRNNDVLNLSFSPSVQVPSKSHDNSTTEYFNNIASKIVNNVSASQNGGFKVNTSLPADTDFFLSSETIDNINDISPSYKQKKHADIFINNTAQDGGARKSNVYSDKKIDFNALKKHIKRAVDLEDAVISDSSIDNLFTDENDEEDEETDSILNGTSSEDEDDDEPEDDEDDEIISELHGEEHMKKKKVKALIPAKVRIIPAELVQRRSKKNKRSKDTESELSTLNSDISEMSENNYKLSESISSPQLMSYRTVTKNNIASGVRKI